MHKFFVSFDAVSGETVRIEGNDANHISFSLRMKKGEKVRVCTPDSSEYSCVISEFGNGYVIANVESISKSSAESPCKIHLFQALPKGNKLETVIQKAVECGVSSITPFESRFCVVKSKDGLNKLDRWNRIALEASKQCGRGIVPAVNAPVSYKEAIAKASESKLAIFCYEKESGQKLGTVLKNNLSKDISVVVGAEGGFSEDEVLFAENNGLTVTGLGPRILRCETASSFVLAGIALLKELCD